MVLEVDPGHLRRLAFLLAFPEPDALAVLRRLVTQEPWLAEAISELEAQSIELWQAEYNYLFLSGYPRTPCPPYESAYREGIMGGKAAQALRDLYLRAGFEIRSMPADYLGAQLEFAACLLELQARRGGASSHPGGDLNLSIAIDSSDFRAFIDELWDQHLCRWLPEFAADLQAHARLSFYRLLGERFSRLCMGCQDGL